MDWVSDSLVFNKTWDCNLEALILRKLGEKTVNPEKKKQTRKETEL